MAGREEGGGRRETCAGEEEGDGVEAGIEAVGGGRLQPLLMRARAGGEGCRRGRPGAGAGRVWMGSRPGRAAAGAGGPGRVEVAVEVVVHRRRVGARVGVRERARLIWDLANFG